MDLELSLFASLKERAGQPLLVLRDLPDDLDVAGLKGEVARRHPELGDLSHVSCVVGTRYVLDDTRIERGEDVAFLPPVSGGSGGAPTAGESRVGLYVTGDRDEPYPGRVSPSHAACYHRGANAKPASEAELVAQDPQDLHARRR